MATVEVEAFWIKQKQQQQHGRVVAKASSNEVDYHRLRRNSRAGIGCTVSLDTVICGDGYPLYRRRNMAIHICSANITNTSMWKVPGLCEPSNTSTNTFIKDSIKPPRKPRGVDEIARHLNGRYIGPAEAVWNFGVALMAIGHGARSFGSRAVQRFLPPPPPPPPPQCRGGARGSLG